VSSRLEEVLTGERDAALEEAAFERTRAGQALARNAKLREELQELREQLKEALRGGPVMPEDASGRETDLAERLRLAMDTNWRIEKQRARLEKKIVELRGEVAGLQSIRDRLERRVRKLEGELRMRQG